MFHVEPKASPIVLAKTKDYLVTEDSFEVHLDPQTQIAETVPAPSSEKLAQYYDSSEYISHGNQKRGWIDHLYAFVQRIMLKQKERWLSKYVKESKRYLDFGCGQGRLFIISIRTTGMLVALSLAIKPEVFLRLQIVYFLV